MFLPRDDPEENFALFYAKLNMAAIPLAIAFSYARNRDVKWALLHGFLGVPYLCYLSYEVLTQPLQIMVAEPEPQVLDLTRDELDNIAGM
jgi:hypothetical protein